MNRPNILLVLLDGCRADRLGCYGYKKNNTSPNIDTLIPNSIVAMNNYATSNCTMPSVISMLTGVYPCLHQAASTTSYYDGSYPFLPEILRDNGYYTFGVSNNISAMSPEWGFVRGYSTYYRIGKTINWFKESKEQQRGVKKPPMKTRIKQIIIKSINRTIPSLAKSIQRKAQLAYYFQNDMGGKKAVETFERALNERDTKNPFFGYVNLPDTHHPFFVPGEFSNKFSDKKISDALLKLNLNPTKFYYDSDELNADEIELLQTMYDRCVAYTDHLVGKMISILKTQGLHENTVIVFASDHGGMLYEKNKYLGSCSSTYEPEVKVPLIFYNPKYKHSRLNKLTSVIDIFPSILEIAQVSYSSEKPINGLSIFQEKAHHEIVIDHPKYPDWLKAHLSGYNVINFKLFSKVNRTLITHDHYKVIWRDNQDPELFNLSVDPLETTNLYNSSYENMINRIEKAYKAIVNEDYDFQRYPFNDIGLNSSKISHKKPVNNYNVVLVP